MTAHFSVWHKHCFEKSSEVKLDIWDQNSLLSEMMRLAGDENHESN
jgi:hypothetical protein